MKLHSNRKNKIIIAIVAILVLLVVGVTVGVIISKDQENKTITGILLSAPPTKTTYEIGEEFDPTGLKIQVIAGNNKYSPFVKYGEPGLTVSGFDSSKATDSQVITVSYKGFTTTFTVKIKDNTPPPTLVSIEVRDLHTTYTVTRWNKNGPSLANAYLILTYSDGSTKGSYEETPLLWDYVEPLSDVEGAGTTQMVINYTEGEGENAVVVSTTVTITITE